MKGIYTIQLGYAYIARDHGLEVVDITVKSGIQAFAPTWEMVWDWKNGQLTKDEHTQLYLDILRGTWKTHWSDWEYLIHANQIALGCYCRPGKFCHRHILADTLSKVREKYSIESKNYGEIDIRQSRVKDY